MTDEAKRLPRVHWTEGDIRRLKVEETNPTVCMMLDLTAQRVGGYVSFREVADKADRPIGQAKKDLSDFTKRLKLHFARENWPLVVRRDADGFIEYTCLSPDHARWWLDEARS